MIHDFFSNSKVSFTLCNLQHMIQPDPSQRPSATELLSLPIVCPSTQKSKVLMACVQFIAHYASCILDYECACSCSS